MGWIYWWLDRQADARDVFGRLHRGSIERRDPIGTLDGVVGLVATARTVDEVAAEAWRRPAGLTEEGMPLPHWDQERHTAIVDELRTALGADRFDRLRREGMALDREAASDLALTLAPASSAKDREGEVV